MTQLPPWHIVEQSILKEKKWLLEVFDFGPFSAKSEESGNAISSDDMLRQISIAIISGKISACHIRSSTTNGLWTDDVNGWEWGFEEEHHGGDWHKAMMSLVRRYFIEKNYEVISEPNLNWGRADLGVFKTGYEDLYVEVGTTSLFKVWLNALTMPNVVFLYIPTTYGAIEFKTNATT